MRTRETTKLVVTERGEGLAAGPGEVVANHDGEVEGLGNRLEAAHQIDRGAYDREIETVGSTDIAVEDLSKMERDHDFQRRLAF